MLSFFLLLLFSCKNMLSFLIWWSLSYFSTHCSFSYPCNFSFIVVRLYRHLLIPICYRFQHAIVFLLLSFSCKNMLSFLLWWSFSYFSIHSSFFNSCNFSFIIVHLYQCSVMFYSCRFQNFVIFSLIVFSYIKKQNKTKTKTCLRKFFFYICASLI